MSQGVAAHRGGGARRHSQVRGWRSAAATGVQQVGGKFKRDEISLNSIRKRMKKNEHLMFFFAFQRMFFWGFQWISTSVLWQVQLRSSRQGLLAALGRRVFEGHQELAAEALRSPFLERISRK